MEQFGIVNCSTQNPKASRGKVLKFSGPAPLKSTEIVSAFITYKRGWNPQDYWWYENSWMFRKVQVLSADSQLKVNLCPVEEMLDEGVSIKYVRC